MSESVIASIASQEIHHRKMTFEEEFRTLLQKRGMPFNERSACELIQLSLAPFQGDLWETLPLRGREPTPKILKLMLTASCRIPGFFHWVPPSLALLATADKPGTSPFTYS